MNDNRNFLSELNKQGFMRQKLVSIFAMIGTSLKVHEHWD